MILMMVVPLILMLILPRMMNDPETKKEMENLNINKLSGDMPEISEMITSFFTGAKPPPKKDDKPKALTSKAAKKRNWWLTSELPIYFLISLSKLICVEGFRGMWW